MVAAATKFDSVMEFARCRCLAGTPGAPFGDTVRSSPGRTWS